jgi:hypothetical protein
MTVQVNFLMQYPEPAASSVMRSHFILLRSRRTSNRHQYDCMNFEIRSNPVSLLFRIREVPDSNLGQETGYPEVYRLFLGFFR